MIYTFKYLLIFCISLLIISFNNFILLSGEINFESKWDKQIDRTWIGPEFWANPIQDWRIHNGRLECVQGGEQDRNIHFLTYQLTPESTLDMKVTTGRIKNNIQGWVGFRFTNQSALKDYRHNCIHGKGIEAGITTEGILFLDGMKKESVFQNDQTLRLVISPVNDKLKSRMVIYLLGTKGEIIEQVEKIFSADSIHGNICLVSSTRNEERIGRFYFKDWQIDGTNLEGGTMQNWGPILWAQYTLSRNTLKLTAQLVPLGEEYSRNVTLQIERGKEWKKIATSVIDSMSRTATFRIENWDYNEDISYRLKYDFLEKGRNQQVYYKGVVRHDPVEKEVISLAGFTGNTDNTFPNTNIVDNVSRQDPDILFFSGDQIYESVGGFYNNARGQGIRSYPLDVATLDYLRKWYIFGWAFGGLLANRPSVIIPDDHDVYQGNIWGHGGRNIPKVMDSIMDYTEPYGGYTMDPQWVNMVQRTQTSHLPDPYDPKPAKQNIGVYYTDMIYGGISFAILEDRKFKWGPESPEIKSRPEKAELLGERQLKFLSEWTADWKDCDMKVALSQTVFVQAHTHFGIPRQNGGSKDMDSNGWPPHARNNALRELRKGFAFMIAGDNHLPTIIHHGIDNWNDAGFSFTVPSISAGFPRAWLPAKSGKDHIPGMPKYTGKYISAFGHPITMWAAANPNEWIPKVGDLQVSDAKSSGYGIVRFNKNNREITIECWRLLADLDKPEEGQFAGWPMTIHQMDNYARKPVNWLPKIKVEGIEDPVVQIINEKNNEIVYTMRIKGTEFTPKVFHRGIYTIKVGEEDDGDQKVRLGVKSVPLKNKNSRIILFEF